MNFTIPPYKEASHFNHEPNRPRKLLLRREQIDRLAGRAAEKGLTLVPWRLYFKNGRVKLELALVRARSCGTSGATSRAGTWRASWRARSAAEVPPTGTAVPAVVG